MFADTQLAARIERAEAGLTAAIVGALSGAGAFVLPIGGGVAAFARAGSPMNKMIGIALDAPPDTGALAAVESAHAERGEPLRLELPTLAAPEVLDGFIERGYRLHGFENVLGMKLTTGQESAPAGVAIERVDADGAEAWTATMLDGFAHSDGSGAVADAVTVDAIAEGLADIGRAPGLLRFVARIDGAIAGAAAARHADGVLQLCGAATLPAVRRRGVQRALLERRLALAAASGCDLAVVTTAPGSQSQANAMRHGFALLYARAILIRQ